jgi:hypothetical protein
MQGMARSMLCSLVALTLSLGRVCAFSAFNLTQYNATLTLAARPTLMGQYVSGDWWLVGPVTVISTSPEAADGRNGFEVCERSVLLCRILPTLRPPCTQP